MTKRTVSARVLILATLDLGRPDSHVHTSWFWTLLGEGGYRGGTPRGHGEGTEQTVEGESGDQETPKAASSPRTLLFLERVPIAPIAGARLTWAMMLSVRSEPELREREREGHRSPGLLPQKGPLAPRPPTPSVEESLPGPRPLTRTVERRLRTRRGPMHTRGTGQYSAALCNGNALASPARPCPATPRPC